VAGDGEPIDPTETGEADAPSVEAAPYTVICAAESCPAKKNRGVIHVVDRRTGEEIPTDPHGEGTLSVDW
jgi:hypothetical protein